MNTHAEHCPHCHADLPETLPRALRLAVVAAAWTLTMGLVFGGALLGPLVILVLPLLIPGGMGLITAAHTWAFADLECEACGKLVEFEGVPLERTQQPTEAAPAETELPLAA